MRLSNLGEELGNHEMKLEQSDIEKMIVFHKLDIMQRKIINFFR